VLTDCVFITASSAAHRAVQHFSVTHTVVRHFDTLTSQHRPSQIPKVLLSSKTNCKQTQFSRSLQRKFNSPSVHPSVHLPVRDANIIRDYIWCPIFTKFSTDVLKKNASYKRESHEVWTSGQLSGCPHFVADLGNIVTVPAICHGAVSVCGFGENRPREGVFCYGRAIMALCL